MSRRIPITSCKTCPFCKWDGYYYPVEKVCSFPDSKANGEIVASNSSGYWYGDKRPSFCPLNEGVELTGEPDDHSSAD